MATPAPGNPIVIIEDDPFDVALLSDALAMLEIEAPIIVCENGAEAIAHLQSFADTAATPYPPIPCAVLVDLNLPGIDGFAVISWIRRQRLLANVLIATISGSDNPADVTRAYSCGADEFLRKPANLAGLESLLSGTPARRRVRE
jgi:CheY-like chemotaxis protein